MEQQQKQEKILELDSQALGDENEEQEVGQSPQQPKENELTPAKCIEQSVQEQSNQLIVKKSDSGMGYEIYLASATRDIFQLADLYLQLKIFLEPNANENKSKQPTYT